MNRKDFIDLKNIDAYSVVRDLLHSWWVILLAGMIGVMASYTVIRESYEPMYQSSAIYAITPKQSTGYKRTDKIVAQYAISAFKELIDQEIMKKRIISNLGRTECDAKIAAELLEETNIMTLTVISNDPMDSFMIIRYVMENYYDLSQYLNQDAVFEVLSEAKIPTYPINEMAPRNRAIKIGLGSMLGMALLLSLFSLLRMTIKTEYVFENKLEVQLYGSIEHEKKNRTFKSKIARQMKSILITNPVVSFKFIESINNIRVKMEFEHERHEHKNVFMVTSALENEGKSTVAINMALSLVKEGKKVIVLDADLRKPAMYKILDINPDSIKDYVNLLQGTLALEDAIYEDETSGISLLMASKGHSSTYEFVKSPAMRELIKTLSMMADYVIVDTPPMIMVSDAEAMADMVDFTILVVKQDFSFEGDITSCINVLNNANSKFLGCIFNDYHVLSPINQRKSYGIYGYRGEAYDE